MVNAAAIWLGAMSERSRRAGIMRLEIAAIAPEKNPMGGRVFGGLWRSAVAVGHVAVLALFLPPGAAAQVHNLVGPQSTTAPTQAPGTGSPGATIVTPAAEPSAPAAVPPVAQATPAVPAGNVLLAVAARY